MIFSATIISNNVSLKHMPGVGEDAQQTLTITKDKAVLQRYTFDHKMIPGEKVEADIDGEKILAMIEKAFSHSAPISPSLDTSGWEILIKDETGFRWFNGSMGDSIKADGEDLNQVLAAAIPLKNLLLLG